MTLQQPPPMPVHQINAQDESHLKVISICHYVMAGFYLLGIGFVILHFILMSFVFRMAEAEHSKATVAPVAPSIVESSSLAPTEGIPEIQEISPTMPAPPMASTSAAFPKEIMPFLMIFYVVASVFLIALCVCNALSGHYIKKRTSRIFSFIIAGINCMQFPLGTALGVFTFIVLTRESVKMAYSMNAQDEGT